MIPLLGTITQILNYIVETRQLCLYAIISAGCFGNEAKRISRNLSNIGVSGNCSSFLPEIYNYNSTIKFFGKDKACLVSTSNGLFPLNAKFIVVC